MYLFLEEIFSSLKWVKNHTPWLSFPGLLKAHRSNWAEIGARKGGASLASCLLNLWLQESLGDWEQAGCRLGSHWSSITLFWLARPGNLTFIHGEFLFPWPCFCSSDSLPPPCLSGSLLFSRSSSSVFLLSYLPPLQVSILLLGWAPRSHLMPRAPRREAFLFSLICRWPLLESLVVSGTMGKQRPCRVIVPIGDNGNTVWYRITVNAYYAGSEVHGWWWQDTWVDFSRDKENLQTQPCTWGNLSLLKEHE